MRPVPAPGGLVPGSTPFRYGCRSHGDSVLGLNIYGHAVADLQAKAVSLIDESLAGARTRQKELDFPRGPPDGHHLPDLGERIEKGAQRKR